MSEPKCPKCNNSTFQLTAKNVKNATSNVFFIHCSSCGCIVGTREQINITDALIKIGRKLGLDF